MKGCFCLLTCYLSVLLLIAQNSLASNLDELYGQRPDDINNSNNNNNYNVLGTLLDSSGSSLGGDDSSEFNPALYYSLPVMISYDQAIYVSSHAIRSYRRIRQGDLIIRGIVRISSVEDDELAMGRLFSVRAPFDGYLGVIFVQPGYTALAGEPLYEIYQELRPAILPISKDHVSNHGIVDKENAHNSGVKNCDDYEKSVVNANDLKTPKQPNRFHLDVGPKPSYWEPYIEYSVSDLHSLEAFSSATSPQMDPLQVSGLGRHPNPVSHTGPLLYRGFFHGLVQVDQVYIRRGDQIVPQQYLVQARAPMSRQVAYLQGLYYGRALLVNAYSGQVLRAGETAYLMEVKNVEEALEIENGGTMEDDGLILRKQEQTNRNQVNGGGHLYVLQKKH